VALTPSARADAAHATMLSTTQERIELQTLARGARLLGVREVAATCRPRISDGALACLSRCHPAGAHIDPP
jgi:hypothetical protein